LASNVIDIHFSLKKTLFVYTLITYIKILKINRKSNDHRLGVYVWGLNLGKDNKTKINC